jgi:carboxynorspermidine decarboxylase
MGIDFEALPTPCYIVDERLLKRNLEILRSVRERTGCSILLAQKGFSMHAVYPLISKYIVNINTLYSFQRRIFYGQVAYGDIRFS